MEVWAILLITVLSEIGFCKSEGNESIVCSTPTCNDEANEILESLNKSVDPCDDFYKFACGNAIEKMTIPADNVFIDMFEIVKLDLVERLRTIVSEPIAKNETKPISQIKKFYQACMNEEYNEQFGKTTLQDVLEQLGGWPVVQGDSWKSSNFSWTSLLVKFRKLGLGIRYFTEMTVDPDPKNSSKHIIELDQLVPGLNRELLMVQKNLKPYLDLMVNISVELGADRARAQKELNESLEFERKLANIAFSEEERLDIFKLLNYMTVKELKTTYPKTPWLEYINGLLPSGTQVKENDTVLVVVPSYFAAMENLIEATPKRVQANYAIWRAIQDLLPYLPSSIYRHLEAALSILEGRPERAARWLGCLGNLNTNLPLVIGSLYVRKFFDEEAARRTTEMVKFVKESFSDILKNTEWMDNITRQRALNKLDKIKYIIGYPKELINASLLEEHYKELELNKDDYLKAVLNLTVYQTDIKFKKLFKPVTKADWTNHADVAKIGASYTFSDNSIDLPAGILQGTFFNKNRPNYLNFGAIGSIIAHELTHGFDDTGKTFDENGNVFNWWAKETEANFKNKTHCIIQQYGNYTVHQLNLKINGKLTLNENIADNGGIKEAYLAYQAWVKANGTEPKLPGLDYSSNQLFWISAARNWCAEYKTLYLERVLSIDTHSPKEFRVIGPFSNSKDFAADFKCPKGSKMNPDKKCAVW